MSNPDRRFLDIGCAAGYFLDIMRAREWTVVGLELASELVNWGRKYLDLDIRQSRLEDANLADDSFDAVTMIEVIEHVPYPASLLAGSFRVLPPGGVLMVTCPNFFESLAFEEDGWEWDVLDPTGHIQCFTSVNLDRAVRLAGFERTEIKVNGSRLENLWVFARKPLITAEENMR